MQAAKLPASAGWLWVRDGFMLFRKQPMAVFFWSMAITLAVSLAAFTAPIGALLFICLMPVITVLTLSACRHIAADRVVLPSMWIKPLQEPGVFRRLFGMGMVYGAVSLAAGLLAFLPFSGSIAQAIQEAQVTNEIMPFIEAIGPALFIFVILYVIIAALFWHAPILVIWHRLKLVQALFFSGVACWRNKWPFVVYGICWFGVFMAIDIVSGSLVWLGLSPGMAQTLQMPFNIAAGGALYCSFYPAYVSVFGVDDPVTRPSEAPARSMQE